MHKKNHLADPKSRPDVYLQGAIQHGAELFKPGARQKQFMSGIPEGCYAG